MKSNLFKSFFTILFALIISQQPIHAQSSNTSRLEAKLQLYDVADAFSSYIGVDYGGIRYENISYDSENLKMDIIVDDHLSDVRYLTSDMLTLSIHNLINTPNQKEYYTALSTLLRQADSKWQITYKDSYGHSISHTLTPDDIDNTIGKSIEELGIDKEQMKNYCIFYHNNLLKKEIIGTDFFEAKASNLNNYLKLTYTTHYSAIISNITPESIPQNYFSSHSIFKLYTYFNHLKTFGFDGLIIEYNTPQGDSVNATISLDDFRNYYNNAQIGTNDATEEPLDTACVADFDYEDVMLGCYDSDSCVVAYDTIYSLDQNPIIQDRLIAYDIEHKKGIGIDGIVDAYVTLSGEYFEFTEILDEITDNASNYSQSFKDLMLNIFAQNEENLNEVIYLYNNGLNGFTYTFINCTNKKKFSTTIDFLEVFEAAKDYGFEIGEASNGSNLDNNLESISEEEKQAYASEFMQNLDNLVSSWIGSDDIVNTHTYIANNYINIICNVTSIEGYTDDFINQCKINYIKQIRPNYTEEFVYSLKYILEVEGYNFIYTDAYTHKSVTMTIDFDEILYFNDDYQYNDDYDFSNYNTAEIINGIITIWDSEMQTSVGQNGLVDVNTTLSNNLIESTFIYDSTVNINDLSNINELKHLFIRDMTDTQDDLDTWGALYYLGIDGFKFILKNQGDPSGKWFTVTIDDIINGIDNLDNIPLFEI